MDNKIIAVVIAVAIVAVGAFLIFGGGGDEVTIGYLPSDHDAALFIADAQGKYAENGIKTKLVQFNNGGDLMTAMASGDVDVGYVGITPVLSSIAKGVPVKVIASTATIRNAESQIRAIFGRGHTQFPPQGTSGSYQ